MKIWLGMLSDITKDPRPLKANLTLTKSGFLTSNLIIKNQEVLSSNKLLHWSGMLFWGIQFHLGIRRSQAVKGFINSRLRTPVLLSENLTEEDLILLFDLDLLPFVIDRFPTNKVLIDFREIYTEQFGRDLKFRLFLRPIRKYIIESNKKNITAGYTVSRGLINFYRDEFHLELSLIRSLPLFSSLAADSKVDNFIRIVYHGVAHPLRGLSKSISTVLETRKDVEFHLYLVGDENYIKSMAEEVGDSDRVHFHSSVDFNEINFTLSQYDLGWCYFEPISENLKNTLPNKFFEYVQAGLGVICGPNFDMFEESKDWNFGFFAEEYTDEALKQLLKNLTIESVKNAKSGAILAKKELIWENEENKFLAIIEKVIET
jgi:glycosyltransferase involved in cell wall biosynthesis